MKKETSVKIIIGLIAGFISGLFSTGGGLVLVLAFNHILKMNTVESRATSIFCVLVMVIVTCIIYSNKNILNWNLGIICALGGVIGSFIGSKKINKIPEKNLKFIYAIFLIYMGINMCRGK